MNFAEIAIQLMLQEIKKNGLELMSRYPNDLLVHDRRMLELAAYPGAKIAWMVGDAHTHLVRLGIHTAENEMVTYLTNLSERDRFYLLTVTQTGCNLKEMTRKEFNSLASSSPVAYTRKGSAESFTLYRKDEEVGHVIVRSIGTYMAPRYKVEVVKLSHRKSDDIALHIWSEKAVVAIAHTLFAKYEMHWSQASVVA